MALGRFGRLALLITQHAAVVDRARLTDWLKAASLVLDGEGDTLSPVNTVAKGVAGSGRLLDVTAQQLAGLAAGTRIWVKSVKDTFRWDPASTDPTDNITCCKPTVVAAAGRFIRDLIAAPEWTRRDWFIDETNGNDENDGLTSGTAIKTDAELLRRWGAVARIAVPMKVTYLAAPVGQSNYNVHLLPGGSVYFQGQATVAKTGTFTAVTVLDRPSATPWDVTEATLGAADVGKLIRITAGTAANIGAYARILKDMGSGRVRVSPFGKFATDPNAPFNVVTPAIGDTFEVFTMTQLNVGNMQFRGSGQAAAPGPPLVSEIVFDTFLLDGSSTSFDGMVMGDSVKIFYARCQLTRVRFTGWQGSTGFQTACGCGLDLCTTITLLQLRASGLLNTTLTVEVSGKAVFLNDPIFQNSRVGMLGFSRVTSTGGAFFDCGSDLAILVGTGGSWAQSGATPDWGTNNTGHGVKVFAGGQYIYTTKPIVNAGLGAGREALVGGTDKLWSAIPYFEVANGAQIALSQ